ncbi:uncharacterized protein LODBEIA_P53880 [Lodderomyces beijingensis]|uniref:PH domain-containing protein n=1 Tax=Lodderomyces beijingensis TaxID=1775926 RepID=A0ABP0ZTE0_9ASCO
MNSSKSSFTFSKEKVLPTSDPKSPFYYNLPPHDSKPIDTLVEFFKFWKYFIKSIIYYFKEISLVKELGANLNYQLINAVQFPGCKDLPQRIIHEINVSSSPQGANNGASSPREVTPTKELKKTPSGSSLSSMSTQTSGAASPAVSQNGVPHGALTGSSVNGHKSSPRPGLHKVKSGSGNQSFLKNASTSLHKKAASFASQTPFPHHHQHHHTQGSHPGSPHQSGGGSTPPLITSEHSNDVRIPPNMFPENSMFTNLPALLLSSHHTAYSKSKKLHKDLNARLIPRLEVLLKQVSHKIKEIKTSLRNDAFANAELAKEISKTGQVLSRYSVAVEIYCGTRPVIKTVGSEDENGQPIAEDGEFAALDDPLLLKFKVDSRLKTQLIFENYMFASYMNLQNISKDLFTYLLKELNWVVDKYGKLDLNTEFYHFLKAKISASSTKDWEFFISHNPAFVNPYIDTEENPKRETRTFKSVILPYADSIQNKCLHFGMMYKKSKLTKSYTRHFYILSCNYLHEFKFDEEASKKANAAKKEKIGGLVGADDEPIKSYNLNDYAISVKEDGCKFIMTKKSTKSKRTFRCLNEQEFQGWFGDLSELLKFGSDHHGRFAFIQRKAAQNGGSFDPKRRKSSASPPSNTTPASTTHAQAVAASKELSLNLNNASVPALSGMFTPRIGTPLESKAAAVQEANPFDEVFSSMPTHQGSAMSSVRSSPALTPKALTPVESFTNIPLIINHEGGTMPGTSSGAGDGAGEKGYVGHDDYVKLQQAFMKQQAEISALRHKDHDNIELIRDKLLSLHLQDVPPSAQHHHHQQQHADGGLNVRKQSDESLNSFVLSPNSVPLAHAAVENFYPRKEDGGVVFNIAPSSLNNDVQGVDAQSSEQQQQSSTRNLPTVFISSNH